MMLMINVLYISVIFFSIISALFISYHIIRYAMSQAEMVTTLTIFLSVFLALLFFNIILFFQVDFIGVGESVTNL